jgi:addiction module HigA family antidote
MLRRRLLTISAMTSLAADTALRLSLYFGNSPEFWMNLQAHYDLKIAQRNLKPKDVRRIKSLRAA